MRKLLRSETAAFRWKGTRTGKPRPCQLHSESLSPAGSKMVLLGTILASNWGLNILLNLSRPGCECWLGQNGGNSISQHTCHVKLTCPPLWGSNELSNVPGKSVAASTENPQAWWPLCEKHCFEVSCLLLHWIPYDFVFSIFKKLWQDNDCRQRHPLATKV